MKKRNEKKSSDPVSVSSCDDNGNKPITFDFKDAKDTNLNELEKNSRMTLTIESDTDYRKITQKIVNISDEQLQNQNSSKNNLKERFVGYFKVILAAQLISLLLIILIKGFCPSFKLSDEIIIVLITTMFVETLGIVAVMIRYAFDSAQEVQILEILNSVVKDYQKFN